jgi:hypothetical protein
LLSDLFNRCQSRHKRTVDAGHKNPPLQIQHSNAHTAIRIANVDAGPRIPFGIIVRTQ